MYYLLTTLIVIAAVLLVLLVLVQNSKGGGFAAGFSSGNQVMGAPKTADFLEKASWTLAIVIVLLSIIAAGVNKSQTTADTHESAITKQVEEAAEALPQPSAADFQTESAGE
ncbi:MAG: preprotein translocase subunit SecG [Paludibacteraceae bacterium]|nr:preprotein translocase subunit SecG [Paludibacteraceae bacterium]